MERTIARCWKPLMLTMATFPLFSRATWNRFLGVERFFWKALAFKLCRKQSLRLSQFLKAELFYFWNLLEQSVLMWSWTFLTNFGTDFERPLMSIFDLFATKLHLCALFLRRASYMVPAYLVRWISFERVCRVKRKSSRRPGRRLAASVALLNYKSRQFSSRLALSALEPV